MKEFVQYQSAETYARIIREFRAKQRRERIDRLGEIAWRILMMLGGIVILLGVIAFLYLG